MATIAPSATDVSIFRRVIAPGQSDLPPAVARYILSLEFPQADHERVKVLAAKARAGILASEEREELDNYERVGDMLSLLKSKARKSLKKRSRAS